MLRVRYLRPVAALPLNSRLRWVKNAALALALVALSAASFAGCGGDDASVALEAATRANPPPDCTRMEPGTNDRFLFCRASPTDRGGFWFRGRGQIPVSYPSNTPAGHWSGGFLSADTLLAQWTAECEVPFAFFVSARGAVRAS
jgi:hypothetical protein